MKITRMSSELTRRLFTVEECYRMAEVGILRPDERVELIRASSFLQARIEAVYLKAVAAVDRKKLAAFQERVRNLGDANYSRNKFEFDNDDIAPALKNAARNVVELGLDRSSPLKILDLATGGGHFPFIAKQYGHDVVGIDDPLYTEILDLYGVKAIKHPLRRMDRLPVNDPFDLITGIQPRFKQQAHLGHPKGLWTVEEWIWFVEHLSELLRYPGRIYFILSRYPVNGQDMCDDLLDLFEANGAYVNFFNRTVVLNLDKPIKLTK
jgi:hypothetical protein